MKIIIINNSIEFMPDDNRLVSCAIPGVQYKLTTPASHCLRILTERTMNVIPHDTFYDEVWGTLRMAVPPNTLYQNISIIRRGLKTVGGIGSEGIVVTHPRRGFQLRPGTTIDTIDRKPSRRMAVDIQNRESVPGKLDEPEGTGSMLRKRGFWLHNAVIRFFRSSAF